MTQDYYRILGVGYDASKEEIRQAYLKLARKYHPDVNKEREAEELLKTINEAYNALTNDEARALYDQDLDIPSPWMRSSVRAALILVCLGVSGVLIWYSFSLQNPDLVAVSSNQGPTAEAPAADPAAALNTQPERTDGENLEPTVLPPQATTPVAAMPSKAPEASPPVATTGPSPKPDASASALPKGSVASKTAASPPTTAGDKQNTVAIAPLKIASVSKSWDNPWPAKKLAFEDSEKKAKSEGKKSIAEQSVPLKASSEAVVEREPQRTAMSEADQKKLVANLPVKTLSYKASPNEILSTIPIPMEDGTTIPANALLKVDARIYWKSGTFRKKLSKFISALIVSRDVDLASEESGLSMDDVRYFAKQGNQG
ncbi:MAG: DnaJ domain-containing protein [Gloeobacterales cyanobacterium]